MYWMTHEPFSYFICKEWTKPFENFSMDRVHAVSLEQRQQNTAQCKRKQKKSSTQYTAACKNMATFSIWEVLHALLYKQHFYKQHQAKIRKKKKANAK